MRGERHTIAYRLKDLERRLDPARFIRLSRGILANVEQIAKISLLPIESQSVPAMQEYVKSEIVRWGKVVEAAGVARSE